MLHAGFTKWDGKRENCKQGVIFSSVMPEALLLQQENRFIISQSWVGGSTQPGHGEMAVQTLYLRLMLWQEISGS